MPGSNQRALEKGKEVLADILIMDLEDGVAPKAKEEARSRVVKMISGGGYGYREVGVRINGAGTSWHEEDITNIASSGADMIVLPKTESPETVKKVAQLMKKSGSPPEMQIWCMIETARGVLEVNAIACSHPRLGALLIGSADLTKDLHAKHLPDRLPLMTSIQLCLLASRANGLSILDSPFFDLSDDKGFLSSCEQGRSLGFDGKTLLHPKTISGANEAFSPSKEDIIWAHKITKAHAMALKEGKAVTLVDGQLVEELHVTEAKRLVAFSKKIELLEKQNN